MNILELGVYALQLAQDIAPYDTGNLAFNAIGLEVRPNGFTITYDDNIAPYVEYLEEGTSKSGEHVGFISQDTTYAISRFIDDTFNDRLSSATSNQGLLAEKSKGNPARNELYLNSIVRGE